MQLKIKPIALLLSATCSVAGYSTTTIACGKSQKEPAQFEHMEIAQSLQGHTQSIQAACYNSAVPLTYSHHTQQAYAAIPAAAYAQPTYSYLNPIQSGYEIPQTLRLQNEIQFQQSSFQYEDVLKKLQIVLVIDHSGSQGDPDKFPIDGEKTPKIGILGNQWTQWDNTYMVSKYLAESIFEYDADGKVPVVFFSNTVKTEVVSNSNQLFTAFNKYIPDSGTNLLGALQTAFSNYATDPTQNTLFIILTDGAPAHGQEPEIQKLIKNTLTAWDPSGRRLNALFIRIGDNIHAVKYLKRLDKCKEIGENVDTKSDNLVYQMGPKNLILNAIYEHLDDQFPSLNSEPSQSKE